jgi:subtilase family serine protease
MKRLLGIAVAATLFVSSAVKSARAQAAGTIIVPESSKERPQDIGVRAHTNFVIYQAGGIEPDNSKPGANWETPGSLGCLYRLTPPVAGCPIKTAITNPSGGALAIAIVDAFDNPQAANDLATFSAQFGLPPANFSQVYANGHKPPNDPGGWSLEEALDIEMAHAMAPNAQIILVEAASNSFTDLYQAEDVASSLVAAAGGGEVTNSWSGGEYSGELSDEAAHFGTANVVYLASSGDTGSVVGVPSAFAKVVSAGGTSIKRQSSGNFKSESCWSGSGGGDSKYEAIPSYQSSIASIVGSKRGTPDYSFDADPASGVAMYDADGGFNWTQVGGTSVSSPALAGIINNAGHFFASSNLELTTIYSNLGNAKDFRDITTGSNGHAATVGWDFCTGVGVNVGKLGK